MAKRRSRKTQRVQVIKIRGEQRPDIDPRGMAEVVIMMAQQLQDEAAERDAAVRAEGQGASDDELPSGRPLQE